MVSISYERHTLVLKMAYNPDCVEEIKETIPLGMRSWNQEAKVWHVGLPYLGTLVKILEEYFDDSEIYLDEDIPNLVNLRDVIDPRGTPYSELYLLPDAPREVCRAAYLALSKLYHPDTGRGDLERMKRINVAWEQIR